jgi:hypothetical protein
MKGFDDRVGEEHARVSDGVGAEPPGVIEGVDPAAVELVTASSLLSSNNPTFATTLPNNEDEENPTEEYRPQSDQQHLQRPKMMLQRWSYSD